MALLLFKIRVHIYGTTAVRIKESGGTYTWLPSSVVFVVETLLKLYTL